MLSLCYSKKKTDERAAVRGGTFLKKSENGWGLPKSECDGIRSTG